MERFTLLHLNRTIIIFLIAITTLHILTGCGRSKEEELLSAKQQIFIDQITLNMSVTYTRSPDATDDSQWAYDTGWGWVDSLLTRLHTESLFALVYISPSLLDAAVDLWAVNRKNADNSRELLRSELLAQFVRPGEKAFLLLITPSVDNSSWWRLHVGDLYKNVKITTIDGATGRLVRHEKSIGQELIGDNSTVSCLLYLQDVVNQNKDPLFNISILNLSYSIRPESTDTAGNDTRWVQSVSQLQANFQFATSDVHILQMVEAHIPLGDINTKYIQPSRSIMTTKVGEKALSTLIELAATIIIKVAFRGIP